MEGTTKKQKLPQWEVKEYSSYMIHVIGAGPLQSAMVNGIRVGYTQVATLVTYDYDQVAGALGCQILHIDLEVAVAQIFGAPCKIETAEEVDSSKDSLTEDLP